MYDPMYETYDSEERLCYCGAPVPDHARELHELKARKTKCVLLQSEIETFQAQDGIRRALA